MEYGHGTCNTCVHVCNWFLVTRVRKMRNGLSDECCSQIGKRLMERIQSWKQLTNRGNLVKPVSAGLLARFGNIFGVKVLREHDRFDGTWGRVL